MTNHDTEDKIPDESNLCTESIKRPYKIQGKQYDKLDENRDSSELKL